MNQEKVTSREYKLVLSPENFTGNETDLIAGAHMFWQKCKMAITPIAGTEGDLNNIKNRREIRFYDTKHLTLQKKDYIFRERINLADGKREATLKFRHRDRYVSQDRDMNSATDKQDVKFEEDIKAPFVVLYSFSSGFPLTEDHELKKVKHIVKFYPGLAEQLEDSQQHEKIILVNDRVFLEIVLDGGEISLSHEPAVNAECALIAWYEAEKIEDGPVIVEFSFRYKNKKEEYSREVTQKAYDLFLLIQQELKTWISDKDATKTGLAFG